MRTLFSAQEDSASSGPHGPKPTYSRLSMTSMYGHLTQTAWDAQNDRAATAAAIFGPAKDDPVDNISLMVHHVTKKLVGESYRALPCTNGRKAAPRRKTSLEMKRMF